MSDIKPPDMSGVPERIWLVMGDPPPEPGTDFRELVEVHWCEDQMFDADIEYVRAALASAPVANERAALAEFLDAASAVIPTESEAYTFIADDGERSTVSHIINLKCRLKDWSGFMLAYDRARAALASAPPKENNHEQK